VANWLTRILPSRARRTAEGAYRPGPYLLSDGWLSAQAGRLWNWWQAGHSLNPYGESNAMVEACISAYAQTIAMCPGDHWRTTPDGGRERVTTSSLSQIIRRPNEYQSISDFLLNLTWRLYERGEAFAYAVRDGRGEIVEMHLMTSGQPLIAPDGSIYYSLGGNEIIERRMEGFGIPVPARDVLHVRLHTPRHPLKGVSPILATVLERAMAGAALNQQVTFYLNQARPSFMLETEEKLNAEQANDLRKRWDEQTKGDGAGGTPILSWGLKAKPVSMSPADARLADMLKITDQSIALAFRMPLAVLGIGDTPFASTESLMSSWRASGLGFALNHIEEAFGQLFRLHGQPEEYLEFDTEALLRSNFKDRIEGLSKGVISGVYSPDEARNKEGLPVVPNGAGAEPRVQQQVVPLSFGAKMEPSAPAAPVPPGPANDDEAGRARRSIRRRAALARHLDLPAAPLDDHPLMIGHDAPVVAELID
jgi:HK97 family phage portal protein